MSSLQDIEKKYANDIKGLNDFISYIENLFFSLCETKHDLIKVLPTLYSSKTSDVVLKNFDKIRTEICIQKSLIEKEIRSLQEDGGLETEPKTNPCSDTADGDLLLYLNMLIGQGKKDRDKLFDNIQSVLEALCITQGDLIHGERFYELYYNKNEVYKLIDIALNKRVEEQKIRLQRDSESLDSIRESLELFNLNNLMNIYRQCFIQTMSFFDNCVFDLFKYCMKEDYFFWLDKFKNSSIKTHEMAEFNCFEDFRDNHINELLKSCYIKDLLQILRNIDGNIFYENGKDAFSEIQELIGRRNVHIHNNGIVDKAYVEGFNIFGKAEGDVLLIDSDLLQRTQKLTSSVVREIVKKFN